MITAAIPASSLRHSAKKGSGRSQVRRTNFAYLSDGRGRLWVALVELRHVQVLDTVRIF